MQKEKQAASTPIPKVGEKEAGFLFTKAMLDDILQLGDGSKFFTSTQDTNGDMSNKAEEKKEPEAM